MVGSSTGTTGEPRIAKATGERGGAGGGNGARVRTLALRDTIAKASSEEGAKGATALE